MRWERQWVKARSKGHPTPFPWTQTFDLSETLIESGCGCTALDTSTLNSPLGAVVAASLLPTTGTLAQGSVECEAVTPGVSEALLNDTLVSARLRRVRESNAQLSALFDSIGSLGALDDSDVDYYNMLAAHLQMILTFLVRGHSSLVQMGAEVWACVHMFVRVCFKRSVRSAADRALQVTTPSCSFPPLEFTGMGGCPDQPAHRSAADGALQLPTLSCCFPPFEFTGI